MVCMLAGVVAVALRPSTTCVNLPVDTFGDVVYQFGDARFPVMVLWLLPPVGRRAPRLVPGGRGLVASRAQPARRLLAGGAAAHKHGQPPSSTGSVSGWLPCSRARPRRLAGTAPVADHVAQRLLLRGRVLASDGLLARSPADPRAPRRVPGGRGYGAGRVQLARRLAVAALLHADMYSHPVLDTFRMADLFAGAAAVALHPSTTTSLNDCLLVDASGKKSGSSGTRAP